MNNLTKIFTVSMKPLLVLVTLFTCLPAIASWQLDNNDSMISFISTKKTNISEVHHFKELKGSIRADGEATVTIDLASVNTGIAIRDERMQSLLFQTELFASAEFSATLSNKFLDELVVGESTELMLMGRLSLHGQAQSLQVPTYVTKLSDKKLLVVSIKPVILNVADFALVEGVLKLQEIAKLPSISTAVPVNFVLTFTR
ncbi:YceI family protein [Colwelliaceae bacterium BS250]